MYGLLGKTLKASFSKEIHAMFGLKNYNYYEVPEEELESFIKSREYEGLNVTMPHKIEVMKYLDFVSCEAKEAGSVNTIVNKAGSLCGYNTDVYGFEAMLDKAKFDIDGSKVLVLGSGGASRAVCYVLKKRNASTIVVISRKGENNYNNIDKHFDADYIINTTPVGMSPDSEKRILDLSLFHNLKGVGDIIYNPLRTELILQAEELGIPAIGGLYMLVAQAKRSDELFTDHKIGDKKIEEVYNALLCRKRNIVLIGMPGSGKSLIGKLLAKDFKRHLFDTDRLIRERTGRTPGEIITEEGESAFRKIENDIIREVSENNHVIIATGGGAVTIPDNKHLLKHNSIIVYVKRPIEKLTTKGRPLSQKSSVEELFNKRKALYEHFADISIENDGELEEVLRKLKSDLYYV
ncbi:MAG: hypothetical protein K6E46_05050 [Lachnospiraceae bacterium]|nr:hypothetical protein [Lachnospiraceae bacterium]